MQVVQEHHILCKIDLYCPVCNKVSCSQNLPNAFHTEDEAKVIAEIEKELQGYIIIKYRKELSVSKMQSAVDAFMAVLKPVDSDTVCIKCGTIITHKGDKRFYLGCGQPIKPKQFSTAKQKSRP